MGAEGSAEKSLDEGKHLTFLSFKRPGGSLPLCDLVRDDLHGKEYGSTRVGAGCRNEGTEQSVSSWERAAEAWPVRSGAVEGPPS